MIETWVMAGMAGVLISLAAGIGTALLLTRTGKDRRQDLRAEIGTLEKSLAGMHQEAGQLRRETSDLRAISAETDRIRSEHAALGKRKEEVEAWAREEIRKIDEVEATRRASRASKDEAARLQDEVAALQARKAILEDEVKKAEEQREKAEAAVADADERKADAAKDFAEQNREREKLREGVVELRKEKEETERRLAAMKEEERSLGIRREMIATDLEGLRRTVASGNGEPGEGDRRGNLPEPPFLRYGRDAKAATSADEQEKLDQVIGAIKEQGLSFRDRVVHRFHTALKVSRISPLTVLAGISGTGKTQLPRAYSRAMGMECLVVPVQPRWDGPKDLLGHFDFLHRRFQATELARLLYDYTHAEQDTEGQTGAYRLKEGDDRMAIVLLDEMNLARTEYYFSEFLSRLELQGKDDEEAGAEIEKDRMVDLDIPYLEEKDAVRVFPSQRILWVGTMNEDESTMTLSDKVIDRANILRFARPTGMAGGDKAKSARRKGESAPNRHLSARDWNKWCKEKQDVGSTKDLVETINERVMEPCGRSFGHRMREAMVKYVEVYTGRGWKEGFADQIEMRLLPKLQGVDAQMDEAGDAIDRLARICETELNDIDMAKSIRQAQTEMQQTGTFNWSGRELP